MFSFSVSSIACAVAGIGGISSVVLIPVFLNRTGGGGAKAKSVISKPQEKKEPWKKNCYVGWAWSSEGSLIVCEDWRKTDIEVSPLFFLWWLTDNSFNEIKQIKTEGDNKISFIFESPNKQDASRKLTVKNFGGSALNGKNLKEICKLHPSASETSPGKISCNSDSYTKSINRTPFYFYANSK